MNPYENHTLKEFYELALSQTAYDIRKETLEDKLGRIRNHIIPSLGDIKIKDFNSLQLEQWQRNLHRLRGVDQTRRCRRLLTAIFDRAIVYDIIESNPISVIQRIREPQENQREIYTKYELETIISNAKGQIRLFILIMVSVGARSGEMVALRFSDIDWNERTLRIQRAIRKGEIKSTKTGLKRDIDIPLTLFNELKEYKAKHPKQEYIIETKQGSYYKESSSFLRRHFKPLLEHLGIRYKSLYSLRHTYATLQLQGGQTINYVAKQLGHTNIQTTQEFYIKYLRSEEDRERTDDIFNF